MVVSLARWDRIKDPLGVLNGFLKRVLAATGAHLLLAGPDPGQVANDPEAEAVLAGVRERWRRLPPRARAGSYRRFPLVSPEEDAAMVNAVQRLAAVVVKKSLQGAAGLGAIGFAVGLFAPPLLAATAVGAVIGTGPANCCTARPPANWRNRPGPPSRSAAPA